MSRFVEFFRKHRALVLGGGAVLLALLAAFFWKGLSGRRNPLLDTPELALAALQSKSLYYNGRARPWLLSKRQDLLTPEDLDPNSERSRKFEQTVQNPKLFRPLDRRYRFDALLFVGDPSEYQPLLDYLVETKDWTLRYVDHSGMIFRRDGGRPWELADFAAVRAHFAGSRATDQAEALAQTAMKLLAVKQPEPAKALLDEGARLASREPHVANGLATYYMDRGDWREASEQIERALSADSDFLPALAAKTQLLYGMRRYNEAYQLSSQLIEKVPDDPNLLFYHAKIAHEAHAYKTEVATLNKLIAQAQAEGRPVGGYQVYLGQAYTSMGDAQHAVDAFELVLDDPDLPEDQRAFARENILRIKKRTGVK